MSVFRLLILTEKQLQVSHNQFYDDKFPNQQINVQKKMKSYKCDVCFKVFPNKSKLTTHYRTHTGEMPLACQICDKKFAQKFALVQHQATYSKDRSFKCSICPEGRYFKTKNHLSKHMVYQYEPKFSCSYCDHKSYRKSDLLNHEKTPKRK